MSAAATLPGVRQAGVELDGLIVIRDGIRQFPAGFVEPGAEEISAGILRCCGNSSGQVELVPADQVFRKLEASLKK
jgi:hypothetical protein